ncbi:MAG TPA: PspA/IM30 family protein [Drouetiella sp.]
MFDRLKSIMNAMFNKGMSNLETPEVLAEQAQSELEGSLKQVREAMTTSLASEKMLEKQLAKAQEEVTTWEKRATVAVSQDRDDIAKEALMKKQESAANLQSLQTQLAEQKKSTAAFKERYQEVEAKFRDFTAKKNDMIARAKASDASVKAHDLISKPGGSSMERWEQKITEKEAKAEAIRELNSGTSGLIEDKFKKLDKHIEMEDELAALKNRMAADGKMKLIVDSEKGKTVVDDNVPMTVEVIDPNESK